MIRDKEWQIDLERKCSRYITTKLQDISATKSSSATAQNCFVWHSQMLSGWYILQSCWCHWFCHIRICSRSFPFITQLNTGITLYNNSNMQDGLGCGRYNPAFVPLTSRQWCACAKCPCPCPPSQVGPWAELGRFRWALWRAESEIVASCSRYRHNTYLLLTWWHVQTYVCTYVLRTHDKSSRPYLNHSML